MCLEERARIYSSDSDEGSDEDKAQRLMKAKKLDSDEVRALCWVHVYKSLQQVVLLHSYFSYVQYMLLHLDLMINIAISCYTKA